MFIVLRGRFPAAPRTSWKEIAMSLAMSLLRLRPALCAFGFVILTLFGLPAKATFHLWKIDQVFSNAGGSVQFIELSTSASGQQLLSGHTITAMSPGGGYYGGGGMTNSFTFPTDLPGDTTNHHFLVATQGFANLGLVTPDYVVPNGFLFLPTGSINYAGVDSVTYASLPTDGLHSIDHDGNVMAASATNFAGQSAALSTTPPMTQASALENPQPDSFQSGVGLVSGWSCAPGVGVGVDGGPPVALPYGSSRADTAGACGANNTNTGFGFLLNFNLLGAGTHVAQLFVNGQPQGSPATFFVTVPSGQFLTGVSKEVSVADFPTPGRTAVLIWQQSQQNFAVKSVTP
jgi:hypothetical protein